MSRFRKGASEFAARRSKAVLALYLALRIIVGGLLVYHIIRGNYESAFTCLLALVLFVLPALMERRLHIDLPNTLEIIILLFIFAAEILGELQSYYLTYPYWDTMLHTTCGFLTAAIGFSMIDILNRNSRTKFNLSPIYCAVAAFCFSMTVGVLWEFWEFTMDRLLRMDMQKDTIITAFYSTALDPTMQNIAVPVTGIRDVVVNGQSLGLGGYLDIGLYDTMEDLFVNFVGAVVFSVIGYFYVKRRGKGKVARQFIPPLVEDPEAPPAEATAAEPKETE